MLLRRATAICAAVSLAACGARTGLDLPAPHDATATTDAYVPLDAPADRAPEPDVVRRLDVAPPTDVVPDAIVPPDVALDVPTPDAPPLDVRSPDVLPTDVPGLDAPTALHALWVTIGDRGACADASDGRVHCWGDDAATPSIDPGRTTIHVLSGGAHDCVFRTDQSVWCWGDDAWEQLGTGAAPRDRTTPVRVPGLDDVRWLGVNEVSTCVLRGADSNVYCWGSGVALGTLPGETDACPPFAGVAGPCEPTPTAMGVTNAYTLSGNDAEMCAGVADGTVWCWGTGGALGAASSTPSPPRALPALTRPPAAPDGVFEIAVGADFGCLLGRSWGVTCWGDALEGVLGLGATSGHTDVPVEPAPGLSVVAIAAGTSNVCAIQSDDGSVVCWGSDADGQLPVDVAPDVCPGRDGGTVPCAIHPLQVALPGPTQEIYVGRTSACAILREDRSVWCWGDDRSGQLGDGGRAGRSSTPLRVPL